MIWELFGNNMNYVKIENSVMNCDNKYLYNHASMNIRQFHFIKRLGIMTNKHIIQRHSLFYKYMNDHIYDYLS